MRNTLARDIGRGLWHNPLARTGTILIVGTLVLAIAAPLVTPFDPLRGVGKALAPPSTLHPLGTDDLGRDVWSQILFGTRISLFVGLMASAIALILGVLIGATAGFFGGWVDDVLMRLTEFGQIIPRMFLAILLVALFGQSLLVTVFAIGVLSWPSTARVLRAEFLSRTESEYVLAARAAGAGNRHIIVREILPNSLAPVVVTASLNVGSAILLEAGLAFLGLADPNFVSLGRMLQNATGLVYVAWWMSVFPGAVIALLVVSMNLVGDGINESLNPRGAT